MSEINGIGEISEGTFPINLTFIQQYQWSEPILMDKYIKIVRTIGVPFVEIEMTILNLLHVTIKLLFCQKLQSNVLHWYHKYILLPIMDRTEATISSICTGLTSDILSIRK